MTGWVDPLCQIKGCRRCLLRVMAECGSGRHNSAFQILLQRRAKVARRVHTAEVAGSTPAAAIIQNLRRLPLCRKELGQTERS